MVRIAKSACLGEASTAADPARGATQDRIVGTRVIGVDVEVDPQRFF